MSCLVSKDWAEKRLACLRYYRIVSFAAVNNRHDRITVGVLSPSGKERVHEKNMIAVSQRMRLAPGATCMVPQPKFKRVQGCGSMIIH